MDSDSDLDFIVVETDEMERFKLFLEEEILTSIYPPPDAQVIKVKSRRPTKPAPQHVQKFKLDAQPMEGENESKTSASDGRIQVHQTATWPNSVHGVIAFKVKNITTWGTGILIGPNIVLTAGHNLSDFKRREHVEVKSMQYLPGMNGQILPFGVIKVEKAFVSPNYIKDGKEDYGILILKESVGEMTGYFGLACLDPGEITTRKINVTGYPGDKVAEKPKTYEMWGMEGSAAHIDQARGQINHLIDTSAGQSGSGVWYQDEEDYYVCGIHVSGDWCVNRATLLTRAVYQQIYAWLQPPMNFREQFFKPRDEEGRIKLSFPKSIKNVECISLLMKYNLGDLTCLNLSNYVLEKDVIKALAQNTSWINLLQLLLFSNGIGSEGTKALAQNTSWINLLVLDLSENDIGSEGAQALSQNTSWINLSALDLSKNNIGSEGIKELAQNTSWINLSVLWLSENNIGSEGTKELAQNTSWINLSVLNLSKNLIGSEGTKELAQNTSWINLFKLDLSENDIGSEGTKALAQNTSWIKLSKLDLSGNIIDSEGSKALAQNTSWIKLSKLDLSWNNIGMEGAKALAQNTSWMNLSKLCLSRNGIGSEGTKALAQNTSWVSLLKLDLSKNDIGSEGAKVLAQNISWTNLSKLDLSRNGIDSEGIKSLAQNNSWINLSVLDLSENDIGSEGTKALARNISWINLSELWLIDNGISSEGKLLLKNNKFWKKDRIISCVNI